MFERQPLIARVVVACLGAGALLTAGAAPAATVSIYKVTDADGRVTYQNVPPGAGAGRVEKRAFDLEANAMNFTRPRAVGAPGGGGNSVNNNDVIARLADELLRRTGGAGTSLSITRGSGSVVFSGQPTTTGILGGGEVSGIVTPSGNLIGADNALLGGAPVAGTTDGATAGGANAGGGTGMGGGAGSGPAITNPSTGSATFTGGGQGFAGNSPTFTSSSATFSSNTGTLGPATPGIGAGTLGATGGGDAANNGGAGGSSTAPGPATNTGAAPATSGAGIAPGTNPFAGTSGAAPRRAVR